MLGERIAEYKVIEKLGCGGFGCVYKGQHPRLRNRMVAIKVFTGNVESESERTKFFNEAAVLDQLSHPNILPILDVGIHNDTLGRELPYLITEYAPHGSLRDRLKQTSEPLPLEEALDILSQIGKGLQYAHDLSIVHCDLKPENLLFNAQQKILIADFGIAVVLSSAKTKQGDFAGSLPYMAPEQFDGKVSKRTDQYALACIAYELFTGRRPFSGDRATLMRQQLQVMPPSLRRYNASLPDYIDNAVLKALSKDRNDRYSSVSDFLTALQTRPPVRVRLASPRRGRTSSRRISRRPIAPRSLPQREDNEELLFPEDEDLLLDEESDRRSRLVLDVDFDDMYEFFPDEEESNNPNDFLSNIPGSNIPGQVMRLRPPNDHRIVRRYSAPVERASRPQPSVPARSARRTASPRNSWQYVPIEAGRDPGREELKQRQWDPDRGLFISMLLGLVLFISGFIVTPQFLLNGYSFVPYLAESIGGIIMTLSFLGTFVSACRLKDWNWAIPLAVVPLLCGLLGLLLGLLTGFIALLLGVLLTAPICLAYALTHSSEENWSLLKHMFS